MASREDACDLQARGVVGFHPDDLWLGQSSHRSGPHQCLVSLVNVMACRKVLVFWIRVPTSLVHLGIVHNDGNAMRATSEVIQ